MTKLLIALVLSILVAILCWAAFHAGQLTAGLKATVDPVYYSDEQTIKAIEAWEIKIPEGARRLSYLQQGFMDTDVWISMEVPTKDRDSLMSLWLAQAKSRSEVVQGSGLDRLDPLKQIRLKDLKPGEVNLRRFDFKAWKQPIAYSSFDEKSGSEYAFVYDAASDKVLFISISGG